MHQNIKECKLLDVGFSLMNLHHLDNQENQAKFVKRVEGHIVLTHDTFLKGKNLNGVITIMLAFNGMTKGSTEFWKRMEKMLQN
jgi:hypothetical protein